MRVRARTRSSTASDRRSAPTRPRPGNRTVVVDAAAMGLIVFAVGIVLSIVGIAFTVSPQFAISALVFLVGLHKLEYFLNSQIIGQRIRNPLWLTLLGLIIGWASAWRMGLALRIRRAMPSSSPVGSSKNSSPSGSSLRQSSIAAAGP